MTEKEYGKLSLKQLRELYSSYYHLQKEKEELSETIEDRIDRIKQLFDSAPPWAYWYELSWQKGLALFLITLGLDEEFKKATASPDPHQAILDMIAEDYELPIDEEDITDEEQGVIASLLFSVFNQLEAISIFSLPMSELVEKARNGNDEALLNAVIVDRGAVAAPSVARRIQLAHLAGDEAFLNKLAKAITRTRPRRPAEEYDDLRFMLEALEASKGLDNLSYEQLYNLFVEELQLYPGEERMDTFEGLRKLIQRRKKLRGT
jgi:hypothetical protein